MLTKPDIFSWHQTRLVNQKNGTLFSLSVSKFVLLRTKREVADGWFCESVETKENHILRCTATSGGESGVEALSNGVETLDDLIDEPFRG